VFLVGDATSLPTVFDGTADDLTITLPWGSLLRAVLNGDPAFAVELGRALRPGGRLRVVTSLEDRDRAALDLETSDPSLTALATALETAGLRVVELRPVDEADLGEIRSSWCRRLGIPSRRPARILVARRPDSGEMIRPQPAKAPAIVLATSRMSDP
jgi:hypothetical protein